MNTIILTAINARYSHISLGMRYLHANMGTLRNNTQLFEFTIQEDPDDIAKTILQQAPAIVALGVYIWNRSLVESVVARLRDNSPTLPIILGGPEIAYDTHSELAHRATCVVKGEGEGIIESLCKTALEGKPMPTVVTAPQPNLHDIVLPYRDYTADDIAHRTLYIETSRGCPSQCEYCISALDKQVRYFDLNRMLPEMEALLNRGAQHFKFVDRSFNVNPRHACELLRFFAERWKDNMQLHLEMTPYHLSDELREHLLAFPPKALHIEAGVQTFNEAVAQRVHRSMSIKAVEAGLTFLINEAKADVHADLIAGLPGETPESFESGVDRLIAYAPSELQIGILKRLHGAPISRHIDAWNMTFRSTPPYDILSTRDMDAAYIDSIQRFSKHWDRVVNRHLLPTAVPLLWRNQPSAFSAFDAFSRHIEPTLGRHSFGLVDLTREILAFLVEQRNIPAPKARRILRKDYMDNGRRTGLPNFLRD